MNPTLYTATSAMLAHEDRQVIIAQNLAKTEVNGYRAGRVAIRSFDTVLRDVQGGTIDPLGKVGKLGRGVVRSQVFTDFRQGELKNTHNEFHAAIEGKGFFAVETPEGTGYTRNGSFYLDSTGSLVDSHGHKVLGTGGPITLPDLEGAALRIGIDGTLSFVSGEPPVTTEVDRLRVTEFEDESQLRHLTDNIFIGGEGQNATDFRIAQGFIERSNVNPILEMVAMIENMRAYDISQKFISEADRMIQGALNRA